MTIKITVWCPCTMDMTVGAAAVPEEVPDELLEMPTTQARMEYQGPGNDYYRCPKCGVLIHLDVDVPEIEATIPSAD